MSKSNQRARVSEPVHNRYVSVLEAARVAHMAKSQAAIDARNARQQAFASELAFLLYQEGAQEE